MKWLILIGLTAVAGYLGYLLGGTTAMIGSALLIGGGIAFVQFASHRARESNTALSLDNVSLASRPQLVPLFKMRSEILALIEENAQNPIIAAMKFDIENELEQTIRHSIELTEAKQVLSKLEAERVRSSQRTESLTQRAEHEADAELKSALQDAVQANHDANKIYQELEDTKKRMEASIIEAESAFATLRSRIALSVAEQITGDQLTEEPLTEMTDRLKRISSTMEETVQVLRGGTL